MAQLKDTLIQGNLTVTNGVQLNKISAPTAASGLTYGNGTAGQVLSSDGSNVYWGGYKELGLGNAKIFYGTCPTAASIEVKTVTCDAFTAEDLVEGTAILVTFANTNSGAVANLKLNVNGTGAFALVKQYNYAAPVALNNAAQLQAGITFLFVFKGTASSGQWVLMTADYNTNSTYTVTSVWSNTAASAAAKTSGNASYYALRSGNIFEITMRYANSAQSALTLNVNSTGAKPIYINGVASSTANYTLPAGKYLVKYDGTAYQFRTDGLAPFGITGTASNVTGTVALAHGGTGATNAATARSNLGLGTAATAASTAFAAASHTHAYLSSAGGSLKIGATPWVSLGFGSTAATGSDYATINNDVWNQIISYNPALKVSDNTLYTLPHMSFRSYSCTPTGGTNGKYMEYVLPLTPTGMTTNLAYAIFTERNFPIYNIAYSTDGVGVTAGEGVKAFWEKAIKVLASKVDINQNAIIGSFNPATRGPFIGNIYDAAVIHSTTGLPRYSTFIWCDLGGHNFSIIGTNDYVLYRRRVFTDGMTPVVDTTNWNTCTYSGIYNAASSANFSGTGHPATTTGEQTPYTYGTLITFNSHNPTYSDDTASGMLQIYANHKASVGAADGGLRYRTGWNNGFTYGSGTACPWATILDSQNAFKINSTGSYCNLVIARARGGYYGILLQPSTAGGMIMSNGTNEGFFVEGKRWVLHYNTTSDVTTIGNSTQYNSDTNFKIHLAAQTGISGNTHITGQLTTTNGLNTTNVIATGYLNGTYIITSAPNLYNSGTITNAGREWFRCYSNSDQNLWWFLARYTTVGTASQEGFSDLYIGNNKTSTTAWNATGRIYLYDKNGGASYIAGNYSSLGGTNKNNIYVSTYLTAQGVYSAVWNDYAECRASEEIEAGYVLTEDESGIMKKTNKRLMPACKVSSDTYGMLMGETDEAKTPLAVAGRVLVYPYQNKENYHLGDAVCSAPNGTVDIMTREEIMMYPERIVGTVSEIPNYEIWQAGRQNGENDIQVNGRIWIYVR